MATRTNGGGRRGRVLAIVVAGLLALTGCALVPSASQTQQQSAPQDGAETVPPGKETPPDKPAPPPAEVQGELAKYYNQKLSWRRCGKGGFQCSTLNVPLDYDKPGGRTIELSVLRVVTAKSGDRLGSLVLNPGGPGGSGVQYAESAPLILPDQVKKHYDLVGFDPRGVGKSTPVTCSTTKERDEFLAADQTPDSPAEQARLQRLAKRFANNCSERSGAELPHVSTADAAKDMDVLRGVLGDNKLNYLGKSYGTYLGATYAEQFPKRVGRFVLDGALDPSMNDLEVNLEQATGFERAMDAFLADCVQRSDCPLGSDKDRAYDRLQEFLADLDEHPLPTEDGRKVTEAIALNGMLMALYVEDYWPMLRGAISSGLDGEGDALLRNSDTYAERGPDNYKSNSGEVIYAVNCADRPSMASMSDIRRERNRFKQQAPMFGEPILWGALPCSVWPTEPVNKPHEIHAKGAGPIVVVGTTRDPATPYEWSKSLAQQLDSGTLVTRKGDGHTGYAEGNSCVDKVINRYYVDGTSPKKGTTC